jgi:hypothetical protein
VKLKSYKTPGVAQPLNLPVYRLPVSSFYNLNSLPVKARFFVFEIFHRQLGQLRPTLCLSLLEFLLDSLLAPSQSLSFSMSFL